MNFIFDNDRPIYIQIVEKLKLLIISGEFAPGEKILSVRDLANQFKVNPNTMQKALVELESLELIYTERTNGKFVTTNKKLIEKYKKDFAKEKVDLYLSGMNTLGFNKREAVEYLQEFGKE